MKTQQDIFHQYESAARSYCRRYDTVFVSAEGSLIKDTKGRQYIDFLASCGALNYGHNDPDMREALLDYITGNGLTASLDMFTVAKGQFLDNFVQLILEPRELDYRVQFTGPTGTNAVEAALKLARKVTGRNNIIAFTNGFHGVTLGALAVTANKFNRMSFSLPGVSRLPYDNYRDGLAGADYLEQLLDDPSSGIETPAAIILETVQGEGGLNAASAEWVQSITAIAKKHGALLIVDDVQAGCGRTGTFFSFEPFAIEPDLVVLSKSLSGFGLPLALLLIKPEYDCWEPAEHNGTFRGNAHAFVTAAVMLEKYWSNDRFSRSIDKKAEVVTHALQRTARMMDGFHLKGRGMMQGLDVGSGKLADRLCRRVFADGLILETSGPHDEVLKILAPLNTPFQVLEKGLNIIEKAVVETIVQDNRASLIPINQNERQDGSQPVIITPASDTSNNGAQRQGNDSHVQTR